ncbi:NmrA family NAD(P)-binding protein [Dyadobacter sp. NIV53]|uniref:NmrA family NAD(P)-binding protein n=1 Tax=Dyadobacter sp. NIV53 TaxID=2861765 RepID=UPI001C87169D|nr:NmrA family NAD(P)-binding protein [Dyadobacter sp. NIV53]
MRAKILVAGATGDLGERIVKALIAKGADVVAIVRASSEAQKIEKLISMGANVIEVNMADVNDLAKACSGVSCVVSALAGLQDVIVDAQSILLEAAVKAGVPRFIPSDYSSDFTNLPEGENRNFDLRKEFHKKLDKADIASTSIFIGAFSDILAYNTPFFNQKNQTIGYWGDDPDWKTDFTTKDNAAEYTAAAALDNETPAKLNIASIQVSANDMFDLGKKIKEKEFKIIPMGALDELSAFNKKERAANPDGENQLYPRWQQSQYMHSMFSVRHEKLDNNRYPEIKWESAPDIISEI